MANRNLCSEKGKSCCHNIDLTNKARSVINLYCL